MTVATDGLRQQIEDRKTRIAEAKRAIENLEKQLPPWRASIVKFEREVVELKAALERVAPREMENIG